MKRKNLKDFKANFVTDRDNYMSSFRKNIFSYIDDKEITLNQISEEADISYSTLKNLVYGYAKDCNLSTAIKLARAFGVSIDRLIGAETIDKDLLDMMLTYKELPKSSKSMIKWHIQNHKFMHETHQDRKVIKVMQPICNCNGSLKRTNDYVDLDVTDIENDVMYKVFFGIKIPCEHYLPHYNENDILLIANDRVAMRGENTVLMINDNLVISRRVVENGTVKYYSIRDNVFRSEETDYVQVVGYIAKVIEGE